MKDYQMDFHTLNDINYLLARIESAGDFLYDWSGEDFDDPTEVFSKIGLGIGRATREIGKILEGIEGEGMKRSRERSQTEEGGLKVAK